MADTIGIDEAEAESETLETRMLRAAKDSGEFDREQFSQGQTIAEPLASQRVSARAQASETFPLGPAESDAPSSTLALASAEQEVTRAESTGVQPTRSWHKAQSTGALTHLVTKVTSPTQAMHLEELRRMRFFTLFAAMMATTLCVVVPMLDGDVLARNLHISAAAITAIGGFSIAWWLRETSGYETWMGNVFGLAAASAVATGYFYWGVYSAVLLVVPIGIYFFALGESYWGALSIYAYVSVSHALLSILQTADVVATVGLVQPIHHNATQELGMMAALQVVFAGAFFMARTLRRSSLDTLERLDGAVRDIAQREALLEEAKEELVRARKVGDPGRFSGQLLGSYELGNILGRGGMGDVYEALHIDTKEPAAVKLLNRGAMANPGLVERFYRELNIARSIRAENVVRVLEFPEPDAPIPYLAMERLRGETLSDELRHTPRFTIVQMLPLLKALTRGIGAAHKLKIIHRDLKPQNILAHKEGDRTIWKILDFGVSKLADQSGTLTQDRMIGTPTYMSPEQASTSEVDTRSDLYSIGVILYRVLTGQPAFRGGSIPAILRAVHSDMPTMPSAITSTLSLQFDCVLAIAIAKNPDDRFSTAQELFNAFEAAAAGSLDRALQRKGERLIELYPWGQRNVV